MPKTLAEEVQRAAEDEKDEHPYDNYTGDLEGSTRAEVVSPGDPCQVDLIMDSTHHGKLFSSYASVVVDNNRSTFHEQVERTKARLANRFK